MGKLLVEVIRGGLVESTHCGGIAVVDKLGHIHASLSDPARVMYARSSAKPLQALPLVTSGAADHYQMSPRELALTCASHNGEEMHAELVVKLLSRAGLSVSDLRCGVHSPYYIPSYETLLREGREITAAYNNCSGKHTGMLLLAKYLGESLDTYLRADHPVQQFILDAVEKVCEVDKQSIHLGVDGCGVPVFALPLERFALAYAKFAAATTDSESSQDVAMARIASAMMSHPEMVAGTDRLCTDLMAAAPGQILAKAGAEGVYCVGLPAHGLGICVKIDDGNGRATGPVIVEVLAQLGVVDDEVLSKLSKWHRPTLQNHAGTHVGELRPVFQLERA